MTLKQINELHDLCFHINELAVGKKDAPFVIYSLIGDNMFSPAIGICVYNGEADKPSFSFTVSTDKPADKLHRFHLKLLNDIKKRLEGQEDE